MKIIELISENVKRIKAVKIQPDSNIVNITGKNAQGKTSVLDSIWFALGGEKATKDCPEPIRKGQKKASVSLDLGEMVVTRTWSMGDKSKLEIYSKEDGSKISSPQTLLNNLVGSLSFDPLEFTKKDDKEKFDTLLSIAQLEENPKLIDKEIKELMDERKLKNKEVDKLKAQVDNLPKHKDAPEEEVNASGIMKEIQEANQTLTSNNTKRSNLERLRNDLDTYKKDRVRILKEIEDLQKELTGIDACIEQTTQKGKELKAEVVTLIDPDFEALHTKLTNVEDMNRKVWENKKWKEAEKAHYQAQIESDTITEDIKALREKKVKVLESAKFPIDGLSFEDDIVTFNGVPFSQCSSAEQLKISLAMAMAINPELKVIRIMDGSLLDSDNMKVIEEMAKEKDYQIWIEKVDESGKVGIVIEDGEIKQ